MPACGVNCTAAAQELRDEASALAGAIKADKGALSQAKTKAEAKEARAQLAGDVDNLDVLKGEWAALRKTCPSIGSLGLGNESGWKPVPAPPVIAVKTDKGKGAIDARIAENNATADLDLAKINFHQIICSPFPNVIATGNVNVSPLGIGGGTGGGVAIPVAAWCAAISNLQLANEIVGLKAMNVELVKMKADPPSQEFGLVLEEGSVKVALNLPGSLSTEEKQAYESLRAIMQLSAYLKAYTTSYERFQGAYAAGDKQSMWRQAGAMESFAILAQREHSALLQRQSKGKWLREADQLLSKSGFAWKKRFEVVKTEWRASGLPDMLEQRLRTVGISPEVIEKLRKDLLAFTEQQMSSAIEKAKREAPPVPEAEGHSSDGLSRFLRLLEREARRMQPSLFN